VESGSLLVMHRALSLDAAHRSARALTTLALAAGLGGCVPEARAQRRPAPRTQRVARRTEPTPVSVVPRPTMASATTDAQPATVAAARTMQRLESVERNLRVASYRHDTRVDERAGRYEFDCSGLIAWVLSREAPEAHRATMARTRGARPLAADYARTFLRVGPSQTRGPWTRVGRVQDARPGDVLAWIKPRIVRSNNTGHVVFVVGAPRPSERYAHAWLVPIADSSRYRHQDDSREGLTRTGLGRGTILIAEDPATGAPRAFGWFGDDSPFVLDTQIAIGRPER
jgi:hypothetical protein